MGGSQNFDPSPKYRYFPKELTSRLPQYGFSLNRTIYFDPLLPQGFFSQILLPPPPTWIFTCSPHTKPKGKGPNNQVNWLYPESLSGRAVPFGTVWGNKIYPPPHRFSHASRYPLHTIPNGTALTETYWHYVRQFDVGLKSDRRIWCHYDVVLMSMLVLRILVNVVPLSIVGGTERKKIWIPSPNTNFL